MDYEQIHYEVVERVARLTLNRPLYRNAQSRRLLEELDHAFVAAVADADVRVIVLRGEGEHFSAGHDLGTPEELADREERPIEEGVRGHYQRTWEQNVYYGLRWRELGKPTIAAVQGYCIFGGWIIASAMDVIFAAEDAKFLASNFQYFSVPWDLGVRKAKEMLFESRFLSGREAMELGLVNRVAPAAELETVVMDYASRVAENDPFQLRMIKLACNQMQDGQGFTSHIRGAHAMYMLSALGEQDPGFALATPEGRRRPMVEQALRHSQDDD